MSGLLLLALCALGLALFATARPVPTGLGKGRPPARNPGPPGRFKRGEVVELGRNEIFPAGMHLELLAPTVIVVAPQGAGKSLYAHELSLRFGCTTIVDDWDGVQELPAGALALTNIPLAELAQVQP